MNDIKKLQDLREKTVKASELLTELVEASIISPTEKVIANMQFSRIITIIDTKIKSA